MSMTPQSHIRIGIGGWTFAPWRGTFYPKGLSQAKELAYASERLTSIEVNGTFYRSQTPATFRKWAGEVPKGFVFSIKGSRFVTNRRVLKEAGESIERFLDSGVTELGDKLGPLLWQFAPFKKFDEADFGGFLELLPGTFNYYAISADGRHYLPFGDHVVLASRLQVGNIRPVGSDPKNVPFAKKYFLGGATSIRGWGRYEVSPLSEGLPIGGNSMLAASAELRADLRGKLGGVLFLDAGNVWAESFGFKLGELRYAVGPGLRYQTPIGPIRFDVGYQLNPIPDLLVNGSPQTRRFRLHFSIGQAF